MPFASLIGHRRLRELLQQAVRRGRVPQSLLLAGPDGVGKRTTALALAAAVNCPRATDGESCGVCPVCLRIAKGTFPDVTVVDRGHEASIKIRALREQILDVVGYRPFEGRRRVFIIDEADAMTWEAQDALLKTLEEPPPSAILILITAYPDTLRPTIQSRCRRLRFGPLPEADVAALLADSSGMDAGRAGVLAAASGGSVARALAEADGDLDDDRDAALALLSASTKPVADRLKAATALTQHGSKRRDREALGARLAVAAALVRDLAVLQADGGSTVAHADLDAALKDLAPRFGLERVQAAYDVLTRARRALDRNASPKIVADWVAVRL